jgi:protein-disulfide isomerase
MKFRFFLFALFSSVFFLCTFASAQTSPEVLATAGDLTFTSTDLTRSARAAYDSSKELEAATRQQILQDRIDQMLVEEEAKLRKITSEKLLEAEVTKKVPDPSEADIKAIYDANQSALGTKTLADVREQIVKFLRRQPEDKVYTDFIAGLRKKIKVTPGVDVNSASLRPADVLATVGTQKIVAAEFNEKAKPDVYYRVFQTYQAVLDGLQDVVYSSLILKEARSQKLEPEEFIAREITNKMDVQTEAERARLESVLRGALFKKYDAKFLLKEPEPPVQNISTDDDPATGSASAPVTIVMFSDFQCPACSATHPIVKEVMQQYGDKVRLVVRDFPLTSIHMNAQKAAEAAGAANAQGKFFEYIDILYTHQSALDNASLKKYASDLGLNRAKFDAELDRGVYAPEIAKDVADGESYGIHGTPTLFINGMKVPVNSAEMMKKLIDKALAQKSSTKP